MEAQVEQKFFEGINFLTSGVPFTKVNTFPEKNDLFRVNDIYLNRLRSHRVFQRCVSDDLTDTPSLRRAINVGLRNVHLCANV